MIKLVLGVDSSRLFSLNGTGRTGFAIGRKADDSDGDKDDPLDVQQTQPIRRKFGCRRIHTNREPPLTLPQPDKKQRQQPQAAAYNQKAHERHLAVRCFVVLHFLYLDGLPFDRG